MEINVDFGRMGSLVNARMAGKESIAMVRCQVLARLNISLNMFLVCKTDNACIGFPLAGQIPGLLGDDDTTPVANMTCYTGGETVFSNHQMCDVTS